MNAETGTEGIAPVTEPVVDKVETAEAPKPDAVQETAEQKAERERDPDGKFRKPVQPRIDELTRQRREAERERDFWRDRATAREAQEAAEAKAKADKEPAIEEFNDYNDYVKALTKHQAKQLMNEELSKRDQDTAKKSAADKAAQNWRERTEQTVKDLPDYEDVIASGADIPVSKHLGEIINDSEFGPRLLYHFVKNPGAAERINAMTPTGAALAVGRIEAGFLTPAAPVSSAEPEPEAVQEVAETPPPVRKTQAPAPAKPVGAGRSTTNSLANASMDDYIKQRSAQGARWARR